MLPGARKAWQWLILSVALGECVPVLVVYLFALDKGKPFSGCLQSYVGYSGFVSIAYGILTAALIDVLVEEHSFQHVKRHCADVFMCLLLFWIALELHFSQPAPVTLGTMGVTGAIAGFAFIGAALAKKDSWNRTSPP